MGFDVHFARDAGEMPGEIRMRVHDLLQELGSSISSVPEQSPFWRSMTESVLMVKVSGWHVSYTIDPQGHHIVVEYVRATAPEIR